MALDETYFRCEHCETQYTKDQFSVLANQYGMIFYDCSDNPDYNCGDCYYLGAVCEKCKKSSLVLKNKAHVPPPIDHNNIKDYVLEYFIHKNIENHIPPPQVPEFEMLIDMEIEDNKKWWHRYYPQNTFIKDLDRLMYEGTGNETPEEMEAEQKLKNQLFVKILEKDGSLSILKEGVLAPYWKPGASLEDDSVKTLREMEIRIMDDVITRHAAQFASKCRNSYRRLDFEIDILPSLISEYREKIAKSIELAREEVGKTIGALDQTASQTEPGEKTKVDDNRITPIDTRKLIEERINSVDKNLPPLDLESKITEIVEMMINEEKPKREAYFQIIKQEFNLNARQIEAFRGYLNDKKKQIKNEAEQKKFEHLLSQSIQSPKELSEHEKREALVYLQDPNLLYNISRDIAYAGGVIAEETNKMMLYLSAISRKFQNPISLVIFGQSSTGKSFLANTIGKFVPPEDRLILSSSSPKGFEYLGEQLKNKFVLIQELEGATDVLPTIRTLQSEGKLARLVTISDPETKRPKSVSVSHECPCTVVLTTTQEGIHNENSTRIFELYVDESLEQTNKVVKASILEASLKHRIKEKEKQRIWELHHNVQRLLETLEIDIPFADHLQFPAKTARNRRDTVRFMQLIKAVAFLRQKQKKIKIHDGEKYIEADLEDYKMAYRLGTGVMQATLDRISERARNVLRVCCELDDELKKSGQNGRFTVNQIQEKAPNLGFDFGNRQDLYKQLKILTEHEYLEFFQERPRAKQYYSVCFAYERDPSGEIINIDAPEIKEITTPSQLKGILSTS